MIMQSMTSPGWFHVYIEQHEGQDGTLGGPLLNNVYNRFMLNRGPPVQHQLLHML